MKHSRWAVPYLVALALTGPADAAPKAYHAPRTHDGRPNLQGLWTNGTYTELERPEGLKTLVITPAEAKAWEAKLAPAGGVNVGPDPLGQATSEFPESGSGLLRINGEIRASGITDPADGQLPYTKAAKAALRIEPKVRRGYDDVEARPQDERCLSTDSDGAPIIPSADTNTLEILQTPGEIVLLSERYHDARIVRMTATRDPRWPASWMGDSLGRWEGETLVVETRNFRPGFTERGGPFVVSPQSVVVERFTRTGAKEIHYAFAVTDPFLFTQTWHGEYLFTTSSGAMFEYACHEGNYSLTTILTAARLGRQEPPPEPEAKPKPAP